MKTVKRGMVLAMASAMALGVLAVPVGADLLEVGTAEPVLLFEGPRGLAYDAGSGAVGLAALDGPPDSYDWTCDIPLHVRAMAKAAGHLFIAGPANVIDTEYAFDHFGNRRVQAQLRKQVLELSGQHGGVFRVVSAADGSTLAERRLSRVPVWDGMAVAGGRVYIAMNDGTVLCFGGR